MKTPHQQRIEAFMILAKQEVPDAPQIPSKEVRYLRAKLILEETIETINALGFTIRTICHDPYMIGDVEIDGVDFVDDLAVSLEQIADGCADISVVTIGTLSACGIHDKELLELVDQSNLAKFEVPKCCFHDQKMREIKNGHYVCDYRDSAGSYCGMTADGPHVREDGKLVKSSTWKAPDIQKLLQEQRKEYHTAIEQKIEDATHMIVSDLPCVPKETHMLYVRRILTALVKFVEQEYSNV